MSARTFTAQAASAFVACWRAMLADKAVATVLFVAGLLYSFFYPWPYSGEAVRRAPVAVVDQDQGSLARQITRYVGAHPQLAVVAVTASLPEAQDLLWQGRIVGVLVLPAGLQREVLAGRVARVEVAGNGAYFLLNKAVLGSMAQAVGTVSAGIEIKRLEAATPSARQAAQQRQPIELRTVALFNTREGYGSSVVPSVLVLIIQQTVLIGIALLMGTWAQERARTVPTTGPGFVGAWLAFASAAVLNGLYFFGWVLVLQDFPRGAGVSGLHGLFAMLALLAVYALVVSAFGLLLGSLFRSREGGMQASLYISVPMLFLAGSSWPAEALPPVLQTLRWALPSTAGVQGFVALNQLGASAAEVRHELLALLGLGGVALPLAWWRWQAWPHRDLRADEGGDGAGEPASGLPAE